MYIFHFYTGLSQFCGQCFNRLMCYGLLTEAHRNRESDINSRRERDF